MPTSVINALTSFETWVVGLKFNCPANNNKVMLLVRFSNVTFPCQTKSSKWVIALVHILSPETNNCSSSISRREIITVEIFHDQSPRKNVAGSGWKRQTSCCLLIISHKLI